MDKEELVAVATQEIEHPTFGVVEQFLEIHEIVYQDGKPEVAGVAIDEAEKQAIVYFSVKDEAFHFAVYLNAEPEPEVRCVDTEDFSHVYFAAYSESHSLQQLLNLTNLEPTKGCNKGDIISVGKNNFPAKGSSVEFKLNPEPGATEEKLKKLLTFLEQDVNGVRHLVDNADGAIQVHTVFHNGNTMLGGIHLDKEDIQRLAALQLAIDFDLYAEGNKFK
jgi:hypothetical protein